MNNQLNKAKLFSILMVLIILISLFMTSCVSDNNDDFTAEKAKTGRIGCLLGSTTSIFLEKEYPDAEILQYNSTADAFEALSTKKIDYLASTQRFLKLYTQKLDGYKVLDITFIPTDIAFAVQKGNDKLRNEINEKLAEYKENGKLDEMVSHWDDCNNYVINDVPENTTGETIVVGTTGEMEPHNFVSNGKLVGIDIEIIGNILYDLGYRVKYSKMAFGAVISALSAGKIDVIAADLSITEERKKSVDYTDIYLLQLQTFMVRDTSVSSDKGFASLFTNIKKGLYNNLIKEKRYQLIIDGLGMTLALTLASALFGTMLGIILCLMVRSRFRALRGVKKVYSTIIEGIPMVVVLLIVCYVILGKVDINGVIIGMLAFGLVFGNQVCGAIENGLNNVEPGQYEAMLALGYPYSLGFRRIIIPQLMRNILPIYRASFTSMIKSTAIAGYVAIQDLTKAGDLIRSRTFDAFIPLLVVAGIYFVLIWIVTLSLRWFETSEERKRRKREVKL